MIGVGGILSSRTRITLVCSNVKEVSGCLIMESLLDFQISKNWVPKNTPKQGKVCLLQNNINGPFIFSKNGTE
jgi:hypothetical protein